MNRARAGLVLALVSWGVSVAVADAALAVLTPADLLLGELVSGTTTVGLVLLVRRSPVRVPWRPAALLGALEPGAAYVLANLGLARTSAAAGALLLSLESVFVVLLAWLLLRERLRRPEALALAVGLVGAALVGASNAGGDSSPAGNVLVALAALAAAGYVLAARRYAPDADPLSLVLGQALWALVFAVPFVLASWVVEGSRYPEAGPSGIVLALVAGMVGIAVPFTLWTSAIPHVRPAVAAVGLNLIPVVGVAASAALGRGLPTTAQVGGGTLIVVGLALLARREARAQTVPVADPSGAPRGHTEPDCAVAR